MGLLARPDDPLLILLRFGVLLLAGLTIYTSFVVETSKKYVLVTFYTALLAGFTAIWTQLNAFNWISDGVYEDWRYVSGAAIYLAVIGKDVRYIYAAFRRREQEARLSTLVKDE